jgi:large-conductance mechanosensitive channel
MACSPDEKDISNNKFGAKFGMSIITIIYFIFILFIVIAILSTVKNVNSTKIKSNTGSKNSILTQILNYVKLLSTEHSQIKKYDDSFTGRFTDWFTKVGKSINSASVLAILAAGVVIGFNGLIMTPLITTIFPDKTIYQNITIPGQNVIINPGQFFIALIGFILSLILFFFVAEIIYIIKEKAEKSLSIILIILLFGFLTFMLIWNAIETDKILKQPDCIPNSVSERNNSVSERNNSVSERNNSVSERNNSQLQNSVVPNQTFPPTQLPLFGVFG